MPPPPKPTVESVVETLTQVPFGQRPPPAEACQALIETFPE
jgi:hypothetical protein